MTNWTQSDYELKNIPPDGSDISIERRIVIRNAVGASDPATVVCALYMMAADYFIF